jgi:methyltransferase (TIGR00027 family)
MPARPASRIGIDLAPAGLGGGMIPAAPSRTALRVAMRRAAHQLLDRPPVLEDPIAITILGPPLEAQVRADPARSETGRFDSYLRAFLAARSRFAEEHLAAARRAGVEQYVILGAGLDTFAYRQPAGDGPLAIWEVDYPATQSWKRELLAVAGIPIPSNVHFVPVDFEHDALPGALAAAGLEATAGTVFSWLGVTPYLTKEAIDATLRYIASVAGRSGGVAFDYALERSHLSWLQRRVFDYMASRVAAAGEPWRTAFDPAALARDLQAMGFTVIEDATPDLLNARYFSGRADGLRVGGMGHMMWAGV